VLKKTQAIEACTVACRIPTPTTAKIYTGTVGNITVHLAHNGKCDKFLVDKVGTNAATLTTYLAIGAFKPDLVMSVGTAGGFQSKGATVATIFVSTALQNHDRRIPLPGFSVFGVGREDSHPAEALVKALGVFL
jgi:5'-methylthioadenosine nucleosidase